MYIRGAASKVEKDGIYTGGAKYQTFKISGIVTAI